MDMVVDGWRKGGKPEKRWRDCVAMYGRKMNLDRGMTEERIGWRRLIKNRDLS